MSKKKACKKCRVLYETDECPICKSGQGMLNWKGRVYIADPQKSRIGKRMNVSSAGEYAVKVS